MNKKLIKAGVLTVSAAMLLSGCYPSMLLSDRPSYNTSPYDPLTPPPVHGGGGSDSSDSSDPDGRGTQLNFNDQQLEIDRVERDEEVAMKNDGVWTVFVYLCGADLESEDGAGTDDMKEMQNATKSCSDLRFVVEAGGAREWKNSTCKNRKSQRLLIQNGYTEVLECSDSRNMGSASTLADFLSWGVKNYPSQYMALDFWDHGGGSINGVCFDELHYDDSLTLAEIDSALLSVYGEMTDRFELIGFDACIMATLETANILVPYARYMVASQDLLSGLGWKYECFGDALNDGAKDGAQVGRYICDYYYDDCIRYRYYDAAPVSVIDLSRIDDFIGAFNAYAADIYEYAQNGGTTEIIKAAKQAMNFGGNNWTEGYTNMVDVKDLIRLTSSRSANAGTAIQRLESCVIYMSDSYYSNDSGGLSVYYPLSVQGSSELDVFRNICVSPYYLGLVDLCAYGSDNNGSTDGYDFDWWLSSGSGFWNSFFDWGGGYDYWDSDYDNDLNFDYTDSSITFTVPPHLDDDGYYCFRLSEDSLNVLDTVYCNVMLSYWDDYDDCEYMLDLGTDDYVDLDWSTGECRDSFTGEWFLLPDGQPLCVYLTDTGYDPRSGDSYNIYTSPVKVNGEDTYLRIKQTYGYDYMTTEVMGIWNGINANGSASREVYQLKSGDRVCPCYPAYDVYSGEYVADYYGDDYVYNGDPEIEYDMLYEGDYYYAFEIYDLFDNVFYSDFVLFGVESDGSLVYYN